jgi:hypothetical protein
MKYRVDSRLNREDHRKEKQILTGILQPFDRLRISGRGKRE